MSYTKQFWRNGPQGGTPRSAERLQYQEDGIQEASDRLDDLEPDVALIKGPPLAPNSYYFASSPTSAGTSTLTTNNLRLTPWVVPNSVTLIRIGAEVTTVGDVGSVFRMGLYRDDGSGKPGARVLDAGTIPTDAVAVRELTINTALQPGIYWIGGVVQGAATTQPQLRVVGNGWEPPIPISNATAPTANSATVGFTMTNVTGALPATFTVNSTSGASVRMFVKTA